jgi:hypothetical protein
MADADRQPFLPGYASYNWTGPPSDTSLQTNGLGGDSRMYLAHSFLLTAVTYGLTDGSNPQESKI